MVKHANNNDQEPTALQEIKLSLALVTGFWLDSKGNGKSRPQFACEVVDGMARIALPVSHRAEFQKHLEQHGIISSVLLPPEEGVGCIEFPINADTKEKLEKARWGSFKLMLQTSRSSPPLIG